jgi:thymidylate kinase
MPRYILEGVDRSGKSTLANHLKALGFYVVHCPYQPDIENLGIYYQRLISSNLGNVVFDRSFISEFVYGTVLRRHSRISNEIMMDLVALFASTTSEIIYIIDEPRALRDRILETKDAGNHGPVLEHLDALLALYSEVNSAISNNCRVTTVKSSDISRAFVSAFISKTPIDQD